MAEQAAFPTPEKPFAISFAEKLVASDGFKALFSEGMAMVEATASYLDGEGRKESRDLQRSAALAYATESMRLTTRLMQITSWLLLQRAVNEGELSRQEAEAEHRKVRLNADANPSSPEMMALLPLRLTELIQQSFRLQARIAKLDELLRMRETEAKAEETPADNPVAQQLAMLQGALAKGLR
jgi:regulator of CtrA degradation